MTTGAGDRPSESPARIGAFWAASALLNGLLLWHFHDRYWYPTDDGIHAHIAERLLAGEIFSLDVQDIHPGYAHFLNVAAFRLFGVDMVSLRYPLILVAFLQSCLVYALLSRRGVMLAAIGSIAATALGVVQFMSPTANWYCLGLVVALACWLTWLPAGHPARLIGAGVLLGVLTLFRQLTGVWAAMGVFVITMLEESEAGPNRGLWLGRLLVLTMLTATLGYLVLSPETNVGGILLIAAWPVAMLSWLLVRARVAHARVVHLVTRIGLGAVLAALPLVLYHLAHGSLAIWLKDVIVVATGHTQLTFFGAGWFNVLSIAGLYQAISSTDPFRIANGLYWTVLPLLSALNGGLVLAHLRRPTGRLQDLALPILASFHALVSLYLQGPLYLYYAVGLTLTSLLWLHGAGARRTRVAWGAAAAALAAVALAFHAGQSRHRTSVQILEGHRDTDVWTSRAGGLDRASIQLSKSDRDTYGRLVHLIRSETRQDDSILALPNSSELYFLAERRNPTRFYNSTMGLLNSADVRALLSVMQERPPRIVVFRPDDKFNTAESRDLMAYVASTHVLIDTIDGAEVYRRQ
jgi:hypothetical protein